MEFTRKPTDPDRIVEQVDLPEGPALLIADVPDYVNLPDALVHQHNLSSRRANVLEVHTLDFHGKLCTHYKLDVKINGKTLWVAKADQFYWHTRD